MEEKELVDNSSELFKEFIDELRKTYEVNKLALSGLNKTKDAELIKNENFKTCIKIASILFTATSNQDAIDSLYLLSKDIDFDTEKFLGLYEVDFQKTVDGNIIPKIIPVDEKQ